MMNGWWSADGRCINAAEGSGTSLNWTARCSSKEKSAGCIIMG